MKKRPTPETDYLAISCYIDSVIEGVFSLIAVPIEDCRKLERERDEAREEWGKASMDAAQLLSEKTKVIAERDELREALRDCGNIR